MEAQSSFHEYLLFDLENVQYIAWPHVRVEALTAVRMALTKKNTVRVYAHNTVALAGQNFRYDFPNPA